MSRWSTSLRTTVSSGPLLPRGDGVVKSSNLPKKYLTTSGSAKAQYTYYCIVVIIVTMERDVLKRNEVTFKNKRNSKARSHIP